MFLQRSGKVIVEAEEEEPRMKMCSPYAGSDKPTGKLHLILLYYIYYTDEFIGRIDRNPFTSMG